MLPKERLEIIKKIAIKEKSLSVSVLSEKFGVRKETIRKDLDKLAEQNLIIRSYGGAVLNTENLYGDDYYNIIVKDNSKETSHYYSNQGYIAKKAIEFVKKGSTIIADGSPVVLEALKLIKDREDVTVISNSISVFNELSKSKLNIISTGGNVNSKLMSFQGTVTKASIKNYNVDLAFVDCKGLDFDRGISDFDEEEAEIKKLMINQASKAILLADHTKYHKTSLVKLFDYKEIDYIITDKEPEIKWINLFKKHNINVIYENRLLN